MGIVEDELADFKTSADKDCRIELNENRSIDIHIDWFQLRLSKDEFSEFANSVKSAKQELEEIKEL